jgi:hypothetical protein
MRATITILGCGVPPIDPSRVLELMANEGIVCIHETGQRRLEFNCYGQASAFRRFASRAMMLPGVTSVTLQRTDCVEQRSPNGSH